MQINREKLSYKADKVLFVITYLSEPAFDWFESIVRDYQENTIKQQDNTTQKIFRSFQEFKKYLQEIFGDINTKCNTK